ncbi:flagellar protein FlgN [Oryzibacter oryziterrae]|uniref:flagellar protein FlgN n=1 Tax=Oryzibacter oryziterrae TaxID=2766474 RepID=UPI001F41E0A3|nr:flagellar protein FlgN [Oryzibacter oryziterrae]
MNTARKPLHRPPVVTSREIAVKLVAKLDEAMGELLAVLQEETALVRKGYLKAASDLAETKDDKATLYTRLMLAARDEIDALKQFAPTETVALIARHEFFRSEVQVNLAVLGTAKDVAEDLFRTVAQEVGRTEMASTYARPGAAPRPAETSARGIAVNLNI